MSTFIETIQAEAPAMNQFKLDLIQSHMKLHLHLQSYYGKLTEHIDTIILFIKSVTGCCAGVGAKSVKLDEKSDEIKSINQKLLLIQADIGNGAGKTEIQRLQLSQKLLQMQADIAKIQTDRAIMEEVIDADIKKILDMIYRYSSKSGLDAVATELTQLQQVMLDTQSCPTESDLSRLGCFIDPSTCLTKFIPNYEPYRYSIDIRNLLSQLMLPLTSPGDHHIVLLQACEFVGALTQLPRIGLVKQFRDELTRFMSAIQNTRADIDQQLVRSQKIPKILLEMHASMCPGETIWTAPAMVTIKNMPKPQGYSEERWKSLTKDDCWKLPIPEKDYQKYFSEVIPRLLKLSNANGFVWNPQLLQSYIRYLIRHSLLDRLDRCVSSECPNLLSVSFGWQRSHEEGGGFGGYDVVDVQSGLGYCLDCAKKFSESYGGDPNSVRQLAYTLYIGADYASLQKQPGESYEKYNKRVEYSQRELPEKHAEYLKNMPGVIQTRLLKYCADLNVSYVPGSYFRDNLAIDRQIYQHTYGGDSSQLIRIGHMLAEIMFRQGRVVDREWLTAWMVL